MSAMNTTEAPRVFPTLRCQNPEQVIRWLCDVLGFTERVVYRDGDQVMHAELAFGSSIVMLGAHRDDAYGRMVGAPEGRRTDSLYVAVDDADRLFARVNASGVVIESEPYDTDYGSRDFACRDPDGNLWSFGTYWPKAGEPPMDAAE